jgi:protein-S-isoprenylcysteine O-methyltransferase Ste14
MLHPPLDMVSKATLYPGETSVKGFLAIFTTSLCAPVEATARQNPRYWTAVVWLALSGWLLFGVLAIGVRVALHVLRTGSTGVKGVSGRPGSPEWIAGIAFVAAIALGVAAPLFDSSGTVETIDELDRRAVHAAGIALYAVGLIGIIVAQRAMGTSWRIGVDESERTDLVLDGPFAYARNPIFTAMVATSLGLALLVPSWVALVSVLILVLALELQTRVVEEPYLARTHREAYTSYARRVGRFVPGVGRLR